MEENESKGNLSSSEPEITSEDLSEQGATLENKIPNGAEKKGSSFLFFKILLTILLLALAGLGGFWSYGQIKKGRDASESIRRFDSKISRLRANQERILETLREIKSEVHRLKESNAGLAVIPERLNVLEKKAEKISETLATVSTTLPSIARRTSRSRKIEGHAEELAAPGLRKSGHTFYASGEVMDKGTLSQGREVRTKKGTQFEQLVKSLLVDTGHGLKWLVKKLTIFTGVAYREILKNFS